jgi:hypothetical protein
MYTLLEKIDFTKRITVEKEEFWNMVCKKVSEYYIW